MKIFARLVAFYLLLVFLDMLQHTLEYQNHQNHPKLKMKKLPEFHFEKIRYCGTSWWKTMAGTQKNPRREVVTGC